MIAVWFSCGAASAVALKKTLEVYGEDHEIRAVNNPVREEHPDNYRFLKDVESWLGVRIERAINPKYPTSSCDEVWRKQRFMSGPFGAPCTKELKKKARQLWEKENNPNRFVLGFTYDEKHRANRFVESESNKLIPILVDLKLTKQHCFDIINGAGLTLPEIYRQGFPNANCIGCVKSTSPTYWNLVRNKYPEVFKERVEQSRDIGAKLVQYKGKRIYLDELDPKAKGRPLKGYKIDCGIFCEED